MVEKRPVPAPEVLDESLQLSLDDLTQRCAVHTETIIELVQIGVLEPRGPAPQRWRFTGRDLVRLHQALRLQRDLGVNLPGLALAIELLEELDELRARVELLEKGF